MNKSNLIFLSAFRDNLTLVENKKRTKELMHFLTDYNFHFKAVNGFWKGIPEVSLMIEISNNINGAYDADIKLLKNLVNVYDQDCMMLVDRNSKAYLIDQYGKESSIGTMKQVTDLSQLSKLEAYTQIDDKYFAVR